MKGFTIGTLVSTDKGLIPIEKLKVGDMVLTHTNKYRKITEIKKEKAIGCYKLQTQGSPNTLVGKDQIFICVEKNIEYDKENKTSIRNFSNRKNKVINKMDKNDFICIGKNTKKTASYEKIDLWFLGKFINKRVLDSQKKETTIFIKKDNKKNKKYLKHLKVKETKNFYKCTTDNEKIFKLCEDYQFHQSLSSTVMELPDSLLKELIYSYVDECGKKTDDNYYLVKSLNKMLIYQLGQIVSNINSFGGFSLFCEEKTYRIQFKDHTPKSANFVRIKNYLWQPIREIVEISSYRGELYSLTVEIDKSYVANGIVVKS